MCTKEKVYEWVLSGGGGLCMNYFSKITMRVGGISQFPKSNQMFLVRFEFSSL